jgi:hypothetical protein
MCEFRVSATLRLIKALARFRMSAHFYVNRNRLRRFRPALLRYLGNWQVVRPKAPVRVSVKDAIKIGNSVGQFVQRVSKIDDADLIGDIP